MRIGRITVSDRASRGIYDDRSGPVIEEELRKTVGPDTEFLVETIPDEQAQIVAALQRLVDARHCDLVVTTGGTGISDRDVTPEATQQVISKELPGFGEVMRARSFAQVPTAILSRATAGVRGRSLIVNLPGKPSAVAECLQILEPAIVEGVRHLQGIQVH
jgi:molybdopterin adenylyltransferase